MTLAEVVAELIESHMRWHKQYNIKFHRLPEEALSSELVKILKSNPEMHLENIRRLLPMALSNKDMSTHLHNLFCDIRRLDENEIQNLHQGIVMFSHS